MVQPHDSARGMATLVLVLCALRQCCTKGVYCSLTLLTVVHAVGVACWLRVHPSAMLLCKATAEFATPCPVIIVT